MSKYFLPLFALLLLTACVTDDDQPAGNDFTFDRAAMLTGWVDNVFLPKQTTTLNRLRQLESDLSALAQEGSPQGTAALVAARTSLDNAYLAWQQQSPFVLAESEALRLRELTNTYPTSVETITANLAAEEVNLELPSNTTAQGFPALDYLLFTNGPLDEEPLVVTDAAARDYALTITRKLVTLHEAHLTALENGREAYIANTGSSATGSIDRTVNDFIFFYERFLRAGKVGIPAGVFSDDPLADRAESLYQGKSKPYFVEALRSAADFFNNEGLREYMDAAQNVSAADQTSQLLTRQFASIATKAGPLNDSFQQQVLDDNNELLALYDELQLLTVLLKVDMLQILNINVDYVDADGD